MSTRRTLLLFLVGAGACAPQVFKPPLTLAGEAPAPSDPSGASVHAPLRRLTRDQYDASVRAVLAPLTLTETPAARFPAEEKAGPFLTNVRAPVSALDVDLELSAAEWLGAQAAVGASALLGCQTVTAACAKPKLHDLAMRAWRRPLTAAETAALDALLASADTPTQGIALAVTAMFASPSFLYLAEHGTPDGTRLKLDGFTIATRLSFFFWNTGPDQPLLDAAAAGALDTAPGIATQAWRLLKDERSGQQIGRFHLQWLGLGALDSLDKDTRRYPFFDASVRTAMKAETVDFAEAVIRRSDGTLSTLLSAPFSAVQGPLYRIYGQTPPQNPTLDFVGVDPSTRGGLLTQPAYLATHAGTRYTSPTQRGVFLVTNVLCIPLGSPPPDVDLTPVGVDATRQRTRRQLVEQHASDNRCAGCHRVMDPVGLAFEHYDAVGAWRDTDVDDVAPVDSSVTLALGDDELDGPIDSAHTLLTRLAHAKSVRACYAKQWYRFALGRLDDDADSAELLPLAKRFETAGGSIPELLISIATSDAFRYRTP